MAATPVFAASPKVGYVQLANADSTNISAAAVTSGASGTRIREIRITSGTTAPGGTYKVKVYYDYYNGTTSVSRVIDIINLTNTTDTLQGVSTYSNVVLPATTGASNTYTIKFSVTTQLASGATLDCVVFGEDF